MPRIIDNLLQARVSDELLERIGAYRRKQPEIPSKAQAVRELIERGLDTTTTRREVAA